MDLLFAYTSNFDTTVSGIRTAPGIRASFSGIKPSPRVFYGLPNKLLN
jgi:hypothetical protein